MESMIEKQEVKIPLKSIWQCGRSCRSDKINFASGEKVEVVGSISDLLTNDIIIRAERGTARIYEPFFRKNFFLLNKKGK